MSIPNLYLKEVVGDKWESSYTDTMRGRKCKVTGTSVGTGIIRFLKDWRGKSLLWKGIKLQRKKKPGELDRKWQFSNLTICFRGQCRLAIFFMTKAYLASKDPLGSFFWNGEHNASYIATPFILAIFCIDLTNICFMLLNHVLFLQSILTHG